MSSSRRRKWAALAAVLAAAGAVLWFAWAGIVPPAVQRRIVRMLDEGGLDTVAVEPAKVGLTETVLRDLLVPGEFGLKARKVVVRYSPLSLMNGRVHAIAFSGVTTTVGIRNGTVLWAPLALLEDGGDGDDGRLPFDRLTVATAEVHLVVDGSRATGEVSGAVERAGDDGVRIDARAVVSGATVLLSAVADGKTWSGSYAMEADDVPTDLFIDFRELLAPPPWIGVRQGGRVDLDVELAVDTVGWSIRLGGTGHSLEMVLGDDSLPVAVGLDTIAAYLSSTGTSTAAAAGTVAGGRYEASGSFDLQTFRGSYDAAVSALDASRVGRLLKHRLPLPSVELSGRILGTGELVYREDTVRARAAVAGEDLVVETQAETGGTEFSAARAASRVELVMDGEHWRVREVLIGAGDLGIRGAELAFRADTVTAALSPGGQAVEGRFRARGMSLADRPLPSIRGNLLAKDGRLDLDARARPLPETTMELSGSINWLRDPFVVDLRIAVPWFELEHDNALAQWLPVPPGDDLGGMYTVKARLQWRGGRLRQRVNAVVREGVWRRPSAPAGMEGVTGGLVLSALLPPETLTPQRFTFDTAYTSALGFGAGVVVLSMGEVAPLLLRLVECSWAGGTLNAYGVKVHPDRKSVHMVLRFSGQHLQRILDIFGYQGARATGVIYGSIPLTVDWRGRLNVSLGEGVLTAGPEGGTIRFATKTAETLLGIEEEVSTDEDELEGRVKQMMRRALEDMAYTELSVTFREVPGEGTLASVHLEGYGPVGTEENRIPVGSLDVRIHDIGKIINSVIRGGGRGRLELR